MNTDKIIAEKIASEYAPKKTSKVVALKKLDRKAKQTAEIFAYTYGIVNSLIFGTGLSFALGAIGNSLIIGIALGVFGAFGMSINYSFYKILLRKGKEKYGSDIIRLAQEIATE